MPLDHPERFGGDGATLAQLDHVVQDLGGALCALLIGVGIGLAAARLMRRRGAHWSWAAFAFGVVVLARRDLGGAAPALAVGALFAAARCRRWQRRDLDAGYDLAAAAQASRTPRVFARKVGWCARQALGRFTPTWRAGELLLGHDERWRRVAVPFASSAGGTHTLVLGATGSGKTVTQCRIALGAIEAGMGAVVIDPKGDRLLRDQLIAAARSNGRRLLEWTPDGASVYNPLARGSETEIADKALAGERFTEPHYLRQAQRYLGHAVRAMRASGVEVTLRGLVEQLDPKCLELQARGLDPARAEETYAYLDSLGARQQSDLSGVRDRLAVLAESDAGRWLEPGSSRRDAIDLLESVRARDIVLFGLQSDSRPLLSQMLAASIVQDLQTVVAASQRHPVRTLVLIDEFSAVAPEHIVRLFGRARSAGISLVLGTQEIADLRPPGRERLLEQVLGNLSLVIAHRQVVPASAETVASLAGAGGAWRVTRHSAGATTRTRVRQPRLDPDRVMRLAPGWGAVIVPGGAAEVRIAHVLWPADSAAPDGTPIANH